MSVPRSARDVLVTVSRDQISSLLLLMSLCLAGNCRTAPSPLADQGAWSILEQFLTTDMTYPQMEESFSSYLGDRYVADGWKDARDALFSGDGDDSIALANLCALKARHMPLPSSSSRMNGQPSSTPVQRSRQRPKVSVLSFLVT
jgi:hypothetical protein